jgi:hypothetical protein
VRTSALFLIAGAHPAPLAPGSFAFQRIPVKSDTDAGEQWTEQTGGACRRPSVIERLGATCPIAIPLCRERAAAHGTHGQDLIVVPVLGNPEMAAKQE